MVDLYGDKPWFSLKNAKYSSKYFIARYKNAIDGLNPRYALYPTSKVKQLNEKYLQQIKEEDLRLET